MKKMMVLLAACAGAVTYFWLRGGGDLGQVKGLAKHAMGRVEDELGHIDRSAPTYVPAGA